MTKLIVLGSASAVPTEEHENTYFVVQGKENHVLVDCVGNPLVRLQKAGVNLDGLNDIILTHCHPDHISGIPSMLMSLWLMGRKTPLNIYGLHRTIDCVEQMMGLYEWSEWPEFFLVAFHRLPADENVLVLENEEIRIFSSQVCHMVPTIGLRIESLQTGSVVAYSCDTEPCEQVERLADQADILIHEATGQSFGHSSAADAGQVAEKAGAKSLYLIHYPPQLYEAQELIDGAKKNFTGPVNLAEDFMELEF